MNAQEQADEVLDADAACEQVERQLLSMSAEDIVALMVLDVEES